MIDIKVDETMINTMLEKAINDQVNEIARRRYFLTYGELAKYLNISKPLIEERLIKNGLPYY
ncbi:excisionase, partial [Salipaludibacillus sp. CF4.18]